LIFDRGFRLVGVRGRPVSRPVCPLWFRVGPVRAGAGRICRVGHGEALGRRLRAEAAFNEPPRPRSMSDRDTASCAVASVFAPIIGILVEAAWSASKGNAVSYAIKAVRVAERDLADQAEMAIWPRAVTEPIRA